MLEFPMSESGDGAAYVRVADVATIISRSREWTYELVQSGQLESEERYVVGRGIRPVRLVKLSSLLAYIGAQVDPAHRVSAVRAALASSGRVSLSRLTPEAIPDLVRRYEDEGEDLQSIAQDYETSARSISLILREHGVVTRDAGDRHSSERTELLKSLSPNERATIKRLYEEGHGLISIAKALGWPPGAHSKVRRVLVAMQVRLRGKSDAAVAKWSARRQELDLP